MEIVVKQDKIQNNSYRWVVLILFTVVAGLSQLLWLNFAPILTMIQKQYNVIMLVGDNLSAFDQVFEDRSVNFGFGTVDSLRVEFGKKFIVLPNPVYGDWTKPLTGERKRWMETGGR